MLQRTVTTHWLKVASVGSHEVGTVLADPLMVVLGVIQLHRYMMVSSAKHDAVVKLLQTHVQVLMFLFHIYHLL